MRGSGGVVVSSNSHRGCVVLMKKIISRWACGGFPWGKSKRLVDSNANFSKMGGIPSSISLCLNLLKPAYDDSFIMVRTLASTRNEKSCSVERTRARLSVCPSPQTSHHTSHAQHSTQLPPSPRRRHKQCPPARHLTTTSTSMPQATCPCLTLRHWPGTYRTGRLAVLARRRQGDQGIASAAMAALAP